MDKRLQNLQESNKRKCVKNEKEIYTVNYEDSSNPHVYSDISSFNKASPTETSSKESVKLSLEVQIANSLKHLITSPKNHNSPLLDVTVIRPSDVDCIRSSEANSIDFRRSEVKHLIAAMEKQKQHKRRLIELCKKEVETSMMNPIMEIQEASTDSNHFILKRNDQLPVSARRKSKRCDNIKQDGRIGVMSDPAKPTINYKFDTMHTSTKPGRIVNNPKQPYAASISILKPLVGEIRNSLKHLEAKIAEGGDHHSKNITSKLYKGQCPTPSNSSTPEYSEDSVKHHHGKHCPFEANRKDRHNTHQIYATPTTFEKLRTLLACQNPERKENQDQDKEKPCLCQHCGMIGVLVDSQKGPVVPTFPLKTSDIGYSKKDHESEKDDIDDDFRCIHRKALSKSKQKTDVKSKCYEEGYKAINDLASRLEALENRVDAQEQTAVPKDYFKRVINKLLHRQNSRHTLPVFKTKWTQYSGENLPDSKPLHTCKNDVKSKNKGIQIEQENKRKYVINPVLVETDLNQQPQLDQSQRATDTSNKKNKAMSAIENLFTKIESDKDFVIEENDKHLEKDTLKEPNRTISSFWRWGEEIIRPGMDLKTKILSLLDERIQNTAKPTPQEHGKVSNVHERKTVEIKTTNCTNNERLEVNLLDTPKPFDDKGDQQLPEKNRSEDKSKISNPSSQALKRVLDLMSEKIYNDHVKPTVDALKREQKSVNKENTEQLHNIKAAMNAAFYKMNTKETQVNRKHQDSGENVVTKEKEIRNIKVDHCDLPSELSHLLRKSGIPVRVNNPSTAESTTSGRSKYREVNRSLIPRLKSPQKDPSCNAKPNDDSKFFIKTEPVNYTNKIQTDEKLENLQKRNLINNAQTNNVKITYMNPKAKIWNEESSVSVPVDACCEEANKAMLADSSSAGFKKCSHFRNVNREAKIRLSQNHSISEKLAILTDIASTEVERAQLWNKIWSQAKHHCKSKQDTVIIQVPTKLNHSTGVTIAEVEFTIEDIQKLANDPDLIRSIDNLPQQTSSPGNMESFLLIRSRRILEDVHKRLENKFLRNS